MRFFSSRDLSSAARFSITSTRLRSASTWFSRPRQPSFSSAMRPSICGIPSSACSCFFTPKVTLPSYSVLYASMVMRISSFMRMSRRPRSGPSSVIWRMSSSKHWLYRSSRTGQMPFSRAWRSSSQVSSCSWSAITSRRVAGSLLAYCSHAPVSSDHSRGGSIAFSISSSWLLFSSDGFCGAASGPLVGSRPT